MSPKDERLNELVRIMSSKIDIWTMKNWLEMQTMNDIKHAPVLQTYTELADVSWMYLVLSRCIRANENLEIGLNKWTLGNRFEQMKTWK